MINMQNDSSRNLKQEDIAAGSYMSVSMKSLISTNYNQNTECIYDDQNFDESNHQFQQMKLRYSLEKPSLNNNSYLANLKEKGLNECKNTKLAWKILEQFYNKSIYLKAKAYMAAQNNKQLFYEMLFKLVLNYLQPTEIFKLLQVSRQFRDNKFKPIIESRMEFLITNENIIYYQSMFNYAMQIDQNRKLLTQQFQHFSKLKNEYEEVIQNDVERTFQDQEFFKSVRNKICLNQILKAISSSNSQLGYIQGINYIAAILLSIMPPEETYWVTKQILEKYNLASLFLDQFQNLELFTFQASCFFKNFIPDLFNHMKIFSVQYEITIQRWVLSFFANDLDVQLMIKILNLFIFKGFKIIIKAVIALLSVHKKNILQLKSQEEIYEYLQEKISEYPVSHVLFLREIKKFKVTRRLLYECGIKYKKCKNNQIPLFELIKTHHGTLEWFNNFGTNSPVSTTKHKTRQKRCAQSNNYFPSTRERIFTTDSARDLINKSWREKNSNNSSFLNLSGQRSQDQQLSQKREHSITYADSISYNKANQILTLKKYSSRDIYENSYQQNYLNQNAQDIQRIDSYRNIELQKISEQNNTRRNGIKFDSNENDRNQDLKMQALLQPSTSESEDEKTNKPLDSQLNHQSFKEFRSITNQSIFINHKTNQNQQLTPQSQNIHTSLQQNKQQNKQPQIITVNLKYPSNHRESIPSLQRIEQNNSFFTAKNQPDLNFQKKQSNSNEQSDHFKVESTSYKNLLIDQNNASSTLISSKQLIEHAISQGNLSYRESQPNGGKSLTPRGNGKDGLDINYLKFLKQNTKNQASGQEPESYNPGRFFKDHLKIQEEIKKKLETDYIQMKPNLNQLNTSVNSQQNTLSNQNLTLNNSKLKQRPERELSANSLVNTSSNNNNNNNINGNINGQISNLTSSSQNNQNSLNQMTYSNYLQLNQSLSSNQIEKIKDIYKQNYNKMQHQQQHNYSSVSNNIQTVNQNNQQSQILQDLTVPQERLHPSYSMHSNEEVILSRKHAYSMFGNTPDSQNTPQSQQIQAGSFTSAILNGIHSQNYNQQTSNAQVLSKDQNNLNQFPQQIQKSYSQMSMYSIANQSKQVNTQVQFIPNNQIHSSIQLQQNMPSIFQQPNQPNQTSINNQYSNNHNNLINNGNNNQIINSNNNQTTNNINSSSNINQANNIGNNQTNSTHISQIGNNIYCNQANNISHINQASNNNINNIGQQQNSMQNQNSNSNLIKHTNVNTFNQNKLNGNVQNSSQMIQVSAYQSIQNNNKNSSSNNSSATLCNNNNQSQNLPQNQCIAANKNGNYSNNSQSTTSNNISSIQFHNNNTKNNKQQLQQQQQQPSQGEQYTQILNNQQNNNSSNSNNNSEMLQISKSISQQNSLTSFNNPPLSQNQNLQNQYQPSNQNAIIQNQIQSKIQYNQQQVQLPQQYTQSGQVQIQNNNLNQLFQNSKLGINCISNQVQQQQYPLTISGNSSQLGQQSHTFQIQQYNNQHSSQSLQKPQSSQSQQNFSGVNQQINQNKAAQQNQIQQSQSQSPIPSSYQLQSQYQSNNQYKIQNNSNQQSKQNLIQNGGYQSPMDQKQKQQLQSQVKSSHQVHQNSQNNVLQLNSNSQSQFNSLSKNLKNDSVSPSEENKQVQKQDIQNIIQLQMSQNQSKFLKVNSYQNAKPQNQNSSSQINQTKKLQTTTINSNKNFGIHLLSQNNNNSNSNSNAPTSNKFQALFFQNQQNQQINQSTQLSSNINTNEKTNNSQKVQQNSYTNSNSNSNSNNITSNVSLNAFQQQIQSNQQQLVSLILNQQKQSQFTEDQTHINNPNKQQIISSNINQNISSTNNHLQKLQERKKQAKFTSFSLTQSEMAPIIQSKVQSQQQQQQQISQNPSLYLN
ncbi:rab-GTPase-TBC domain protein (macronuclear) [Tetrahymena thermophila SB210]|uniref:Rab-GTPase-TBC domain protein n=1 Tax=Tetrahymena thermophila (strain SB210) TaxID=312017 RepID=Q23MA0_TETTS|nr:rab-GTPase-TBC domain protein [Tetrahymena thermophila SB210]EAR97739.2 rab-GTPase-TBC domain protein [Tetrahymena thermophila SB210]|eukprot:XP_001017984.2 rab-GTPase-TBC domain protein [Tetrahymena thermophila SB210]